MSNTDGEDTQKVSLGELLLNAGTRIVYLEKQSNDQVEIITHLEKQLASLREQLATEQDMRSTAEFANRMIIKDLNEKLKQKEDENRELKDDYKDLVNSIQRLFQTLIARQYNNIGVWSNERQDYNHQLINELEELLKTHNTRKNLSA